MISRLALWFFYGATAPLSTMAAAQTPPEISFASIKAGAELSTRPITEWPTAAIAVKVSAAHITSILSHPTIPSWVRSEVDYFAVGCLDGIAESNSAMSSHENVDSVPEIKPALDFCLLSSSFLHGKEIQQTRLTNEEFSGLADQVTQFLGQPIATWQTPPSNLPRGFLTYMSAHTSVGELIPAIQESIRSRVDFYILGCSEARSKQTTPDQNNLTNKGALDACVDTLRHSFPDAAK